MTTLFPRLSSAETRQRMADFRGLDVKEIATRADATLDSVPVKFAATGGERLSSKQQHELRSDLRNIARASGYPSDIGRAGQQRFDRDTSLYLRVYSGLEIGEAVRAETWQFVAAGLVPDLVYWRFAPEEGLGGATETRYLGGNRNCFGRLWQRAVVLWDDRLSNPAEIIELLKEDNFVAILERSAFSTFPDPCREAARAFLLRRHLARNQAGKSREEQLLRDAMCRIVRMTGYATLWALPDTQLQDCMAQLFDAALIAMGIAPVSEDELVRRQPALKLAGVRSGLDPKLSKVPTPAIDGTANQVNPTPLSPVNPNEPAPLFGAMSPSDRTSTVWRILIGLGEAPLDVLVRVAAHALKVRGQLAFERLREGGLAYKMVEDSIERGVRFGQFDKLSRGCRRAVVTTLQEIPLPVVESIIRRKLVGGLPEDHASALLVSELRQLIGSEDHVGLLLLVDGVLLDLTARGVLVRVDGLIRPLRVNEAEGVQ